MKHRPEVASALKRLAQKATESFLFFDTKVLGTKNIIGNSFQEEMSSFFEMKNGQHVKVVRVPRGHSKTTRVISHILWRVSIDPNERILVSGPVQDHAWGILDAVKTKVRSNKLLRSLFPHVWPDDPANECEWWTRERIQVPRDIANKNPTVSTTSVDAGKAGSHYTLIYADDQVNDKNYISRQMRDATWTHTLNLHALLDDQPGHPAEMLYANTPWHPQDATMRLTSSDCSFVEDVALFERGVYRAGGVDDSMGVIWPEIRSEEFIRRQRAKGMRFFSPHYLMKPLAEGAHPFNIERLERYAPDIDLAIDGAATWKHPHDRAHFIHMAVDTNTAATTAADPAVVLVAAKDCDGHMWVIARRRLKGPTLPQLFEAIHAEFMRWRPQTIHMELRAEEDTIYYELQRFGIRKGVSYPIHKLVRGGRTSKASKFSRIIPMAIAVNEGRVHVPAGADWQEFIEEMDLFDEKCDHDDQMDCAADIWTHGRIPQTLAVKEMEAPMSPGLIRVIVGPPRIPDYNGRLMVAREGALLV